MKKILLLFLFLAMLTSPSTSTASDYTFNKAAGKKLAKKAGTDELVFIQRKTYQSSHYYTDFIDGCKFFGTDLCVLNLKTGDVRSLLPEKMKTGIVGRCDISYDGKKIVFDWKKDDKSGFHIWEVDADGKNPHQLTFPPADEEKTKDKYHLWRDDHWHWIKRPFQYPVKFGVYGHWTDDMHPCYLPDGGIAFISTRCRYGILCDGPDVLTSTVLYRIDADGKNMEKLSNSSVSEANPTMTQDGRLIYTRWEYLDKGASCVKCVWSMLPDGTASAEVYGNDLAMPPSILHTRSIPGSSNLYVGTHAPHCPNTGVGGLIIMDTKKNIRSEEAMSLVTPETKTRGEGYFTHPWNEKYKVVAPDGKEYEVGSNMTGPFFADPYPLDKDLFVMTCMPKKDDLWLSVDGYGLYLWEGPEKYTQLLDAKGTSLWCAIPLKKRAIPTVRRSVFNEKAAAKKLHNSPLAVAVVTDIYHGLENTKRGEVKYIRINEQVPRPWASRRFWSDTHHDQQHSPVGATHLGLRVQWGIVPVEKDGSAHFYVPADRNIFLQALNENFEEIQRERTYVNYRPGEVRSCIGCHETPNDAPPAADMSSVKALKRDPSMPGPQPGEKTGQRVIDFEVDVQPVLNKHCVECHNGKSEKDKSLLDLRGDATPSFNLAYENLLGFKCGKDDSYKVAKRQLVGKVIREIRPKVGNAEYLEAKSLGSTTAKLVDILRNGIPEGEPGHKEHQKVKLSPEEILKISTWIDANCQYYGSYWGRKSLANREHPNYRRKVTFAEAIGTECTLPDDKR